MCIFGGGQKAVQALATPPPPDPAPTPVPADPNPSSTQDQKRMQIANLKKGFASTITNAGGPQGLTGKGPDLNTPAATNMFPGQKSTLGG